MALSIDSSTGVTLAFLGKLCISDFQGLAVLSLWDSLQSSTQEGRIVPGWPMRLGETLLLCKSKDKKCCLYEMPQVTAPIWVLGDVIAKFSALHATSYRRTYKSQILFGSQVTCFWREPFHHVETPTKFLPGGLQAKLVLERTTYCVTWGVLWRVPSSISASRLRSDASSWAKCLRNPEDQDDCKKGTLSNQPRLTYVTPTALLGSWLLQPVKGMVFLWIDFKTHAKWQGSVEEPVAKDFVASKVSTIKLNEVQGTNWNVIKYKERLGNCPEAVVG